MGAIVYVTICIVAAVLMKLFYDWMAARIDARQPSEEEIQAIREVEAAEGKILALPMEAAREQALERLRSPKYFDCEPNENPPVAVPRELSPLQRELFSRYKNIDFGYGLLSIETAKPFERDVGFLRIGDDEDCIVYLVVAGREEIYTVSMWDGPTSLEFRPHVRCPTIYHLLLLITDSDDDTLT